MEIENVNAESEKSSDDAKKCSQKTVNFSIDSLLSNEKGQCCGSKHVENYQNMDRHFGGVLEAKCDKDRFMEYPSEVKKEERTEVVSTTDELFHQRRFNEGKYNHYNYL